MWRRGFNAPWFLGRGSDGCSRHLARPGTLYSLAGDWPRRCTADYQAGDEAVRIRVHRTHRAPLHYHTASCTDTEHGILLGPRFAVGIEAVVEPVLSSLPLAVGAGGTAPTSQDLLPIDMSILCCSGTAVPGAIAAGIFPRSFGVRTLEMSARNLQQRQRPAEAYLRAFIVCTRARA